jgi:hypothetical protein
MSTQDWLVVIEEGDEVYVDGELLYVERKARKKWYKPFDIGGTSWWCYDGYGEDRLVKESDMLIHSDAIDDSEEV